MDLILLRTNHHHTVTRVLCLEWVYPRKRELNEATSSMWAGISNTARQWHGRPVSLRFNGYRMGSGSSGILFIPPTVPCSLHCDPCVTNPASNWSTFPRVSSSPLLRRFLESNLHNRHFCLSISPTLSRWLSNVDMWLDCVYVGEWALVVDGR